MDKETCKQVGLLLKVSLVMKEKSLISTQLDVAQLEKTLGLVKEKESQLVNDVEEVKRILREIGEL